MFYPLGVASPGFSGLDTTIEAIEEIKLAGATGQRFPPPIVDLSDDKAAMPTADIMDQVGANAAPPLIELPDGLAQALAKIGLGGIQHVISKTGIQITEFSDEAASFQFGFDLQSSDEKRYRIGISITSLPGEAVKKN
jgi:hypothetical protein